MECHTPVISFCCTADAESVNEIMLLSLLVKGADISSETSTSEYAITTL